MPSAVPNVLFIMCDQLRHDAIAALGNRHIHTPNFDRLVRRGLSFTQAYSSCPVCVAARYTIRTGCEPPTTRYFRNGSTPTEPGQAEHINQRCGPYLAQTMASRGYRTFGVGKFHTHPVYEQLGYQTHLHTEELPGDMDTALRDAYWGYILRNHAEYSHIEQLHGERTEMYYMPQTNPLPPELNVESFVADRVVEQLQEQDDRPYFGFVSFVGPHPPLAPPVPFNRLYHPDRMPPAICGDIAVDHMDEYIPWMNDIIWAEGPDELRIASCRARYYGEITYIDWCLGRILDAVEARPDADNTLICFYSDHGDHMGDHHAWQKESFFDVSAKVPFLLSWPAKLPGGGRREELVCLTDLFAIATGASGAAEVREGHDVLGMLAGKASPRQSVIGYYGPPGTEHFKIMVRAGVWKYIYFANGGREQLFRMDEDPHELRQLRSACPKVAADLRRQAVAACQRDGCRKALDGDDLKALPYQRLPRRRVYQFAGFRGVTGFPDHPCEVLDQWKPRMTTKREKQAGGYSE